MSTWRVPSQKRNKPQIPAGNEGFLCDGEKASVGVEPTRDGFAIRCEHRKNRGLASSVAQKVATDMAENGCERLISVEEIDPDLARLVTAWARLSATAKRMILAALEADEPCGGE